MLCTDSFEDVALLLDAESLPSAYPHRISTSYLLAISSQRCSSSNRRICFTLRPQERCTFSTGCNAGTLSLRSLRRCQNEIARELSRIEPDQA